MKNDRLIHLQGLIFVFGFLSCCSVEHNIEIKGDPREHTSLILESYLLNTCSLFFWPKSSCKKIKLFLKGHLMV